MAGTVHMAVHAPEHCVEPPHDLVRASVTRNPSDSKYMPQPLPTELSEYLNISDKNAELEIRLAYSRILLLERAAHCNANREICEQKLIHVRVLGYLILEGPSMRASEFVAREVNACQSEDQLDHMGEMYPSLPPCP